MEKLFENFKYILVGFALCGVLVLTFISIAIVIIQQGIQKDVKTVLGILESATITQKN